jgi:hypothetical protein
MLSFFDKYNYSGTSQNGEEGILKECIRRIGLKGIAVEFGAPTKKYYSNIYFLVGNPNWQCYYFDSDPMEEGISKLFVTEENVNEEIPDCNILSIDIDLNDYYIWEAYEGYPDIVIIEINSGIHPEENVICEPNLGTSYKPMVELGIEKGYFLLCHTGNLIFVRNDYYKLFHEVNKNPLTDYQYFFRTHFLHDHVEKWEEKR